MKSVSKKYETDSEIRFTKKINCETDIENPFQKNMKRIPKSVSKKINIKNVVVVDVAEGGVEGSVTKEVELGEGWGRPMERAGKWVEEAMRKARPSPEGQEGEERMEKEKWEEKKAVELVWE